MTVWSAGARASNRRSRYTQLSAPMTGRAHMTPTTAASKARASPPTPHRIAMPRRSSLLSGTASALELPLFPDELLPDVSLQLAEVVVAASYLGRPEILEGRVVLPRHLAELLHGALVGPREPRLGLREDRRRCDEMGVESDALFEVGRRRGHADS